MPSPTERAAVWDAMLESEYQRRYWHEKSAQFQQREKFLQILLAVLSSSALLTALSDLQQLWIWKSLSLLTAILATIQPFLSYSAQATKMCDISSRWHQLEIEYEAIWRAIDNSAFPEDQFKQLRNAGVDVSNRSSDLPHDDIKIQESCYQRVLTERGISK